MKITFESKKYSGIIKKCDECNYRGPQLEFIDFKCPICYSDYTHYVAPTELLCEINEYYGAIWEIQVKIRNKLKWSKLTDDEDKTLQWVADMINEELNDRKLHHYWNPREE
jgi:hypothetical protein